MRHIGRLFSPFLRRHRIAETVRATYVCSVARDVLKKTMQERSSEVRVRFIKHSILHLEVTSSALSSDLHMRRYDIQKAVNTALKSDIVESVYITTV